MRVQAVALALLAFTASTLAVSSDAAVPHLALRSHEIKLRHRELSQVTQVKREEQGLEQELHARGKKSWLITNGKATWYGGGQLDNPACGGGRPSDNDLVVAVSTSSGIPCHSTVHIHYHGKMVSAKVVDHCDGCDSTWLDLTKGTFKKLAGLDVGELHNLHIRVFPA